MKQLETDALRWFRAHREIQLAEHELMITMFAVLELAEPPALQLMAERVTTHERTPDVPRTETAVAYQVSPVAGMKRIQLIRAPILRHQFSVLERVVTTPRHRVPRRQTATDVLAQAIAIITVRLRGLVAETIAHRVAVRDLTEVGVATEVIATQGEVAVMEAAAREVVVRAFRRGQAAVAAATLALHLVVVALRVDHDLEVLDSNNLAPF